MDQQGKHVTHHAGYEHGRQRSLLDPSDDGLPSLPIIFLGFRVTAAPFLDVPLACPIGVLRELFGAFDGTAHRILGSGRGGFLRGGRLRSHLAATLFGPEVVQAGGSLAGKLSSTVSSTSRCCIFFSSFSAWAGRVWSIFSSGIAASIEPKPMSPDKRSSMVHRRRAGLRDCTIPR